MQSSRNVAVGALSLAVTVLVGVLLSGAASADDDFWSGRAVRALLVLTAVLFAVGIWSLGTVYFGWPWPRTHEEKVVQRAKEAEQAILSYYSRRHALEEIHDELNNNARGISNELANRR